jgi:HAD superfamily hydrolase (TIGR01549 family)
MHFDTVVLDVDGTLVDSNYHHTRAWQRAFAQVGLLVPAERIHRAIGMGGERLVPHVTDQTVEDACGDRIRSTWKDEVDAVLAEIPALTGAEDLLDALRARGLKVVLATSGKPEHTEHSMTVLDARDRIDHLATSADVDASKPAPDLLTTALRAVDGTAAVMIGDTVWDAAAAGRAGMRMIGVLSGGIGRAELTSAGAEQVYNGPGHLAEHLDEVLDEHPPVLTT